MAIRLDDLSSAPIAGLLREHHAEMALHSPPESIHALDLDALRSPDISFWAAWDGDRLLGCGALRQIDSAHAEIKSMRTASAHQRKGIARQMLGVLLDEASRRGYRRISLETGAAPAFDRARALYRSVGFDYCGPFADYVEDPYSVFMTLELQAGPASADGPGSRPSRSGMAAD